MHVLGSRDDRERPSMAGAGDAQAGEAGDCFVAYGSDGDGICGRNRGRAERLDAGARSAATNARGDRCTQ